MTLTGLLGGSFNPAHHGHRQISLAARRLLGLDELSRLPSEYPGWMLGFQGGYRGALTAERRQAK